MKDDDEHNDELTPEEELNAENEMELLRLNLEYGAESFIDEDAPPEVVSMFLQQIRSFEEKFRDGGEMSTVGEALEGLDIPHESDVQEHELEDTIERLLDDYVERGVMIDRPDHLSPREYYIFITQDLMDQPIMSDRPQGFTAGYLYNEIYQDHPDFIEENAAIEIEDILTLEFDYEGFCLAIEVESEGGIKFFEDVKKEVEVWRSQFESIEKISLDAEDSIKDNGSYHLTFDIAYRSKIKGQEAELQKGLCLVKMVLEDRCWRVKSLKMPGLKL